MPPDGLADALWDGPGEDEDGLGDGLGAAVSVTSTS
jgi:hypothetical protein